MSTQRRKFNGAFKARVVVEARKGGRTVNELASAFGVHRYGAPRMTHGLLAQGPIINHKR